jgi:N-acyl homoserine lactone hydrolase
VKESETMKLFLMNVGSVRPPHGEPFAQIPVPAYLLETDEGAYILIDTGLSSTNVGLYQKHPERAYIMDASDYVVNQLAKLHVTPQDIRYVVCTHFDPDHAGNLAAFPDAEIVVQRRLYQAAMTGEVERFKRTREQWSTPGLRFLLVDGDTTLVPGVRLVESSGHTPGHQSVLLHLPHTGPVLLAIDALPFHTHTDAQTRAIEPFDLDEVGVRASTRKLGDIVQHEKVMLTIYGHDPEQWQSLKLLPDYYD